LLNVFYGRGNNPLKLSKTRGKIRLSSEGEGADIKQDTLYSFNTKDYKIKKRKLIKAKEEEEEEKEEKEEEKQNRIQIIEKESTYDYTMNHEDIIAELVKDYIERIEDPKKLSMIDIESEIRGLLSEIATELRGAYFTAQNTYIDDIVDAVNEIPMGQIDKEQQKL